VRLSRIPRSAPALAVQVAGRSSLDAVAEPGLATQFEPDPSRSPLSSATSPVAATRVVKSRPGRAGPRNSILSRSRGAACAVRRKRPSTRLSPRLERTPRPREQISIRKRAVLPLRAIVSALFPGLRLALWQVAGDPLARHLPQVYSPKLPERFHRVGPTVSGHTVHELERLPADRHERGHLAPAIVCQNALVVGAEDPVRGAHGAEREHERLAAKLGPASLAHPHLAAHLPRGALDHGETRNTKDLAARVVDPGISDRAQEDGRRHRSELRDRKKLSTSVEN